MDNSQEIKREKVRVVPIKFIDDFPDHPFKVVDDESMEQLIRSIDLNGVLTSVIARKKEDKRYDSFENIPEERKFWLDKSLAIHESVKLFEQKLHDPEKGEALVKQARECIPILDEYPPRFRYARNTDDRRYNFDINTSIRIKTKNDVKMERNFTYLLIFVQIYVTITLYFIPPIILIGVQNKPTKIHL